MSNGASVSQKWLLAVVVGIVVAGGGGWMSYIHQQIDAVAAEQKKNERDTAEVKKDTAVIREKVNRLEQDVKEIKDDQKEQSRKLDEILRRVR